MLVETTNTYRMNKKRQKSDKSNPENNLMMTFIISVFIFIMFVSEFHTRLSRKLKKDISINERKFRVLNKQR